MKKTIAFLRSKTIEISAFAVVFYMVSLFLTLDVYCKTQVTPETPLLNIAGLPFLRMEFTGILFSLTFCVGGAAAVFLRKRAHNLLPFVLGMTGLLTLFMSLFSVYTMQLLAPTMRISHVIMTVSRVLAIVAGSSGGFMGAAGFLLLRHGVPAKVIITAVLTAAIFSMFSNAENMQGSLYFVCGVLLILSGTAADLENLSVGAHAVRLNASVPAKVAAFLTVFFFTGLGALLVHVVCENIGMSVLGYTVLAGVLLCVLFLIVRKIPFWISAPALLIGDVFGYLLLHYASETLVYSGNRVVYRVPIWLGVFCIAAAVVSLFCFYIFRKKVRQTPAK